MNEPCCPLPVPSGAIAAISPEMAVRIKAAYIPKVHHKRVVSMKSFNRLPAFCADVAWRALVLIGSAALLTLAGCGRGFMQFSGEREPWRREAEVACLNSGTIKESPGIVKVSRSKAPACAARTFR